MTHAILSGPAMPASRRASTPPICRRRAGSWRNWADIRRDLRQPIGMKLSLSDPDAAVHPVDLAAILGQGPLPGVFFPDPRCDDRSCVGAGEIPLHGRLAVRELQLVTILHHR